MFLTESRLDILAPVFILPRFVRLAVDLQDLCVFHRHFFWKAHRAASEDKLVVLASEVG